MHVPISRVRSTLRRFGFIGYGNRRCCPLNGFAGGELDAAGDVSRAAVTQAEGSAAPRAHIRGQISRDAALRTSANDEQNDADGDDDDADREKALHEGEI